MIKFQTITSIARQLFESAMMTAGIDPITWERLTRRSDIICLGNAAGQWNIPEASIHPDAICYCAGCGENITFDLDLIHKYQCQVFAFDPTPRAIEHVKQHAGNEPSFHFHEYGLWNKQDVLKFYQPSNPEHVSHSILNLQLTTEYIEIPVKPLDQIMQELGHQHIDLLKMDIEGAEYNVIETIVNKHIPIKALCIEFDEVHSPADKQYAKRMRQAVRSLTENGYRLVHISGRSNYTFTNISAT